MYFPPFHPGISVIWCYSAWKIRLILNVLELSAVWNWSFLDVTPLTPYKAASFAVVTHDGWGPVAPWTVKAKPWCFVTIKIESSNYIDNDSLGPSSRVSSCSVRGKGQFRWKPCLVEIGYMAAIPFQYVIVFRTQWTRSDLKTPCCSLDHTL